MRRLLPQLIVLAAAGVGFGVAYRYFLNDPSEATAANYLRSGLHGMAVTVFGWGANLYFNTRVSRWLRTWPLPAEIALRAVAMATAIAAVISVLQALIYDEALTRKWLVEQLPRILAVAFVLSAVFGSLFELIRLIGGRVLLNVVLGRYRNPIREDRVMMFLDLAGSTSLAEALGEVRMEELLTRFFFDIDEPIVAHGGEVHAYVGDEVIVSWPLPAGVSGGACLDCFFAVRDRIEERAESYRRQFGSVPQFRAGLHAGPVVIGECGDSRRQIAYFGDTMNVTARLQEHCKAVGRTLLVSADLLKRVRPSALLRIEALGQAALRGRAATVEVFAVERGLDASA
ncbi:MAG: adenylate/guanylate cyclase domain-containing protein [Hyphomicrobiales bacterium]|nr:adenylate/guanylate cyclase domain-containing protein [Hyphomicrobiales bacterium]